MLGHARLQGRNADAIDEGFLTVDNNFLNRPMHCNGHDNGHLLRHGRQVVFCEKGATKSK